MSSQILRALLVFCAATTWTYFCEQTCYATSEPIKVEIIGGDNQDTENEQVLSAFKKLMLGLGQKDIGAIGECLSPDVILFYNHDLVYGKQAVLDHISKRVLGKEPAGTVNSITVHHPFIKVKGQTAMVSFRAVKQFTGAKPTKMESWCWEVFERKDNQWKVLQFHSNWTPIKASGK